MRKPYPEVQFAIQARDDDVFLTLARESRSETDGACLRIAQAQGLPHDVESIEHSELAASGRFSARLVFVSDSSITGTGLSTGRALVGHQRSAVSTSGHHVRAGQERPSPRSPMGCCRCGRSRAGFLLPRSGLPRAMGPCSSAAMTTTPTCRSTSSAPRTGSCSKSSERADSLRHAAAMATDGSSKTSGRLWTPIARWCARSAARAGLRLPKAGAAPLPQLHYATSNHPTIWGAHTARHLADWVALCRLGQRLEPHQYGLRRRASEAKTPGSAATSPRHRSTAHRLTVLIAAPGVRAAAAGRARRPGVRASARAPGRGALRDGPQDGARKGDREQKQAHQRRAPGRAPARRLAGVAVSRQGAAKRPGPDFHAAYSPASAA